MCLHRILSFSRCHHEAQTLALCGRRGPLACDSLEGRLTQRDAVCHGCHRASVVALAAGPDAAGGAIRRHMPFAYVVHGLPPPPTRKGLPDRGERHVLVRAPGAGADPLEELVARMGTGEGGRRPREAEGRPSAATCRGPGKRVSFARAVEVQYFRRDLAPRSVRQGWCCRAVRGL